MTENNAKQYEELKSELAKGIADFEQGNFFEFNPISYEQEAFMPVDEMGEIGKETQS